MGKVSQNKLILEYLMEGHTITPLVALRLFGCLRLSARIYELRKRGIDIRAMTTKIYSSNGPKIVTEYWMANDDENIKKAEKLF